MKLYETEEIEFRCAPKGWRTVMLRFLLSERITDGPHETPAFLPTGIPFISVDGIQDGELILENTRFISEEQHDLFCKKACPQRDDILLGKAASTGKIARVKTDATFSIWSPLALLRPHQGKILPAYIEYALKSPQVQAQIDLLCTSSTQKNISMDAIPRLRLTVPKIEDQHEIVNYLDRRLEKLAKLIKAKENLLAILDEKRSALIAAAVTRGLNSKASFRDSGSPWLGEIPSHWDTERTKWLFIERDERSETGEEEMLTVSHITGVTPRSEKNVNMFEAESTEGYKVCYAGDLVINTLWAWMGAMGVSPMHGIVSPAYHIYTPCERLDPAYVDALVRIPVFAQEVIRFSKGVWSSRLRLYPEGLYEIYLPVPPLDEQRAIVSHIAMEAKKLDALREAAERTIALSKERRAALISEAVMGRIEVIQRL